MKMLQIHSAPLLPLPPMLDVFYVESGAASNIEILITVARLRGHFIKKIIISKWTNERLMKEDSYEAYRFGHRYCATWLEVDDNFEPGHFEIILADKVL